MTDADVVAGGSGRLDGAVALVTGASRGIGKGCAVELGAAGASVYVTGRTLADDGNVLGGSLESTVEAVAARGGEAVALCCDHRDDREVEEVFSRITADRGRLDVLVNNAFAVPDRIDPRIPFWETPISDWDVMIDVGTRSAYAATHHAARLMVPAGRGLVVNVSSAGAIRYFHHVAYGIGKAALDRLTKDAARPLHEHGVTVVSVWPYLVRTERVQQMPGLDRAITESPEFTGRGIVALACDTDVGRWAGRAVTTHKLATVYGFTDVDGHVPPEPPWQPAEPATSTLS